MSTGHSILYWSLYTLPVTCDLLHLVIQFFIGDKVENGVLDNGDSSIIFLCTLLLDCKINGQQYNITLFLFISHTEAGNG